MSQTKKAPAVKSAKPSRSKNAPSVGVTEAGSRNRDSGGRSKSVSSNQGTTAPPAAKRGSHGPGPQGKKRSAPRRDRKQDTGTRANTPRVSHKRPNTPERKLQGGRPVDYTLMDSFELAKAYVLDSWFPADVRSVILQAIRDRDHVTLSAARRIGNPSSSTALPWYPELLQLEALFKKNESLGTQSGREKKALQTFVNAEAQCAATNRRLQSIIESDVPEMVTPDLSFFQLIQRMRGTITGLLGDFDQFECELPGLLRVTDGATADRPRRTSQPWRKLVRTPYGVALKLLGRARNVLQSFGLAPGQYDRQELDTITTVPKTWETDRTITKVPLVNLAFQLAFDSWMKPRLERFGVYLRDQAVNQILAGLDGNATIDLKTASDTLALLLFMLTFPEPWRSYLLSTRSHGYTSKVIGSGRYEKYAAMGNGTTFVVETVVFYALCKALGCQTVCVYGDDIIVENEMAPHVERALSLVGFEINDEKSFNSGPYRESCGAHWYNGEYVTPQYIRRNPATPSEACHFVNQTSMILGAICQRTHVTKPAATAVGKYLARICKANPGLRRVPYNGSSNSGIWVLPLSAWRDGILRYRKRNLRPITRESALEMQALRSHPDRSKRKLISLDSGADYQAPSYRGYVTEPLSLSATRHIGAYYLWHHNARSRSVLLGKSYLAMPYLTEAWANHWDDILEPVTTSRVDGKETTATRMLSYVEPLELPAFLPLVDQLVRHVG
jgi:hypothetical protein